MKLDFNPQRNVTIFDHLLIRLNKINKINDLLIVSKIIKNWPTVLAFRIGLKKANFIMELRNGKRVRINNSNDYFSWWSTPEAHKILIKDNNKEIKVNKHKKIITFKFKNKIVYFLYDSYEQLTNTIGMIDEQFIKEQYNWLDVKNKYAIDIGANIGDTAIYFALNGAKHVYSFEPYPYSYKIASKNINLNKLQNKITLNNDGCSGKQGNIHINNDYKNFGGTDLKEFDNGNKIKLVTLKDIIDKFNIGYPAVLKVDCEGCEYDVLLKTKNSDLQKFKQIEIEYHYRYLNLKKKLESAGFTIKFTKPKYTFNKEADNNKMIIGMIYAERD